MYTRILVPLDGSALAEAAMSLGFQCHRIEPSVASRLVDGLEAEAQAYFNAITNGVPSEGIQTFSLLGEIPRAELIWRSQTRSKSISV